MGEPLTVEIHCETCERDTPHTFEEGDDSRGWACSACESDGYEEADLGPVAMYLRIALAAERRAHEGVRGRSRAAADALAAFIDRWGFELGGQERSRLRAIERELRPTPSPDVGEVRGIDMASGPDVTGCVVTCASCEGVTTFESYEDAISGRCGACGVRFGAVVRRSDVGEVEGDG